ncbi:MAG: ECF transporter S component, partial [Oscillospiraceae bacterium]|nr:ECF transporter S component [Oscillospiraceae bacterium]
MKTENHAKVRRLVTLALLAALIVVLQSLSTLFPAVTPVNLTLVPIVIGAILYGPGAGAILGGVFTAVVLIAGFTGTDVFTSMLLGSAPVWTVLVCAVKGVGCGAAAGAVYRLLQNKNRFVACLLTAVVAPIVNSGVFTIGVLTVLRSSFETIAASFEIADAMQWLFVGILGVNFLIEFTVNVVLSSAIAYITKVAKK